MALQGRDKTGHHTASTRLVWHNRTETRDSSNSVWPARAVLTMNCYSPKRLARPQDWCLPSDTIRRHPTHTRAHTQIVHYKFIVGTCLTSLQL